MNQMKRLIDVFPDWMTGDGIFSYLQNFDVPWKNDDIATELDLEYYGNISGEKLCSPLIYKIVSGETVTDAEIVKLARVVYAVNAKNWSKLWDTLNFEYNPIENYRMEEIMTDDETVTEYGRDHTRTDNLQHTKSGTETETPNTTETRTDNLQHTKAGTETQTPNTTETRTDNLQHTKAGTETQTPNTTETRTDNLQHTKTGSETETPNTTETTTPNLHNVTETGIFGFNSSVVSDDRTSSTDATGTNTVTKTGTDQKTYNLTEGDTGTSATAKTGTDQMTYNLTEGDTGTSATARTGTDQMTYNLTEGDMGTSATARTGTDQMTYNLTEGDTGTVRDLDSGSDTQTRNYELMRSGNVGVTTSQQMIQSERDLWVWNYFREVVFPDIDKVLCLPIY